MSIPTAIVGQNTSVAQSQFQLDTPLTGPIYRNTITETETGRSNRATKVCTECRTRRRRCRPSEIGSEQCTSCSKNNWECIPAPSRRVGRKRSGLVSRRCGSCADAKVACEREDEEGPCARCSSRTLSCSLATKTENHQLKETRLHSIMNDILGSCAQDQDQDTNTNTNRNRNRDKSMDDPQQELSISWKGQSFNVPINLHRLSMIGFDTSLSQSQSQTITDTGPKTDLATKSYEFTQFRTDSDPHPDPDVSTDTDPYRVVPKRTISSLTSDSKQTFQVCKAQETHDQIHLTSAPAPDLPNFDLSFLDEQGNNSCWSLGSQPPIRNLFDSTNVNVLPERTIPPLRKTIPAVCLASSHDAFQDADVVAQPLNSLYDNFESY